MKKLFTLAVLASSLIIVGCNNSGTRDTMTKFLSYIDGEFQIQVPCPGGEDLCYENLAEYSVVDESAEGDNRVVIKKWVEGFQIPCYGLVNTEITADKINKCICLVDNNIEEIIASAEEAVQKNIDINKCFMPAAEGHWEYRGIEFPEDFDFEKWKLNGANPGVFAEILGYGFHHFGILQYEPGDDEYFYNYEGKHVLFSENVASLKDLELMGARVEDSNALNLGEKLAAQYGLSEERGQEVAKTVSVYNKLVSKRALTPFEQDSFTNKLLGVNYKEAVQGINSGDSDEFNALMEKAAETNGTSPEAVSAIIKDMIL